MSFRKRKSRNLILFCAFFILGAFLWFYLTNTNEQSLPPQKELSQSESLPTPSQKQQVLQAKKIDPPQNLNTFASMPPSQKAPPPSARTNKQTIENATFRKHHLVRDLKRIPLKDFKINLIADAYACERNECPNEDIYQVIGHYHIVKGPMPAIIDKDSRYVVIENPSSRILGVWEKKIILIFNENFDQTTDLKNYGLSQIKILGDKIGISYYEGKVSHLPKNLNQLREIAGIETIELDIVYRTQKPI